MGLDFDRIDELNKTAIPLIYPPTENDKEPAIFKVKPLTPKQADVLRKRHTKTKFKGNTPYEKSEEGKIVDDTIDAAIVDWSGVYRGKEPLKCTKKEKIWLLENAADVAEWLVEEIIILSKVAERSKEKNLKN